MKRKFKLSTSCYRELGGWSKAYTFHNCRFKYEYYKDEADEKCPKRGKHTSYSSKDLVAFERTTPEFARIVTSYKALLRQKMDKSVKEFFHF